MDGFLRMMDGSGGTAQAAGKGRLYAIGELAVEFGLTHRTIRYYEDMGLLSPERQGQNRVYTHRDHGRLALICRGKRLGFSIAEIKEFLTLYDSKGRQERQMQYLLDGIQGRKAQLERQLDDVRTTLEEMGRIEQAILTHLKRARKG